MSVRHRHQGNQNDASPLSRWGKFLACFDRHSSFFTAIGTVLTLAGLAVAIWQISDTKDTLKSSISYQIFKDNDDIMTGMGDAEHLAIYEYDPKVTYAEEVLVKVRRDVHRIIVFNATVWRQKNAGLVDKTIADAVSASFCNFLNLKYPNDYWKSEIATGKKLFAKEFVNEINKCVR